MRQRLAIIYVLVLGLLAVGAPADAADGDGIGKWFLRNSHTEGSANVMVRFAGVGGHPIVGDWDGDGTDSVGTFDAQSERWRLARDGTSGTLLAERNFTTTMLTDVLVSGVSGDWNGDGQDTIGLYDPATGTFFLRNSNTPGPADVMFSFGESQPRRFVVALAGDWNGDGVDTVGLFRRDTNRWRLRNSNSAGQPDHRFLFGRPGSTERGIVGDWDGDGVDTVGTAVVDAADYVAWHLRNSNAPGTPDLSYSWGVRQSGSVAIAGDWDGDGAVTTGFRRS